MAEQQPTEQVQVPTPIDSLVDLDALPMGSVIRSDLGGVWLVDDPETDGTELRYIGAGVQDYYQGRSLLELYGSLFVIWDPRYATS